MSEQREKLTLKPDVGRVQYCVLRLHQWRDG